MWRIFILLVFLACDLVNWERIPCDLNYEGNLPCQLTDTGPAGSLSNVIDFTVTPANSKNILYWTKPMDAAYVGVKILRKTENYPVSPTDGTEVYQGSDTNYKDTGLVNGDTYYYKAFSYDAALRYSSGVTSSGTPISNWNLYTVDSSEKVGTYTAIALDSAQKVHIIYYDYGNKRLKYLTNQGGNWTPEVLDAAGNVGDFGAMAIDSLSKIHVSYRDLSLNALKYITNTTGSWNVSKVDPPAGDDSEVGAYTSIAVDSNNRAHISFYDYTNLSLKYAANQDGTWVVSTIDSETSSGYTGDAGWNTSIALDSNNKVHISYRSQGYVKYASNTGGSWSLITIDSNRGVYTGYTSIGLDSNNKAHIAFYDNVNYSLKYATNESGSWETHTVDSGGDIGEYASISLDSSDNIHISYYDNTNFALKYATNSTGTWLSEFVDSTGNQVGEYSSIGLDANNKVHISYFDKTNQNLKYANNIY